ACRSALTETCGRTLTPKRAGELLLRNLPRAPPRGGRVVPHSPQPSRASGSDAHCIVNPLIPIRVAMTACQVFSFQRMAILWLSLKALETLSTNPGAGRVVSA